MKELQKTGYTFRELYYRGTSPFLHHVNEICHFLLPNRRKKKFDQKLIYVSAYIDKRLNDSVSDSE